MDTKRLPRVISGVSWRYSAKDAPATARDELALVPGVIYDHEDHTLKAPWNALEVVAGFGALGIKAPRVDPPIPWSPAARVDLLDRMLRSGVKASVVLGTHDFYGTQSGVLDFQAEAIWWLLQHGSGLLHEAPGAGKTLQALAWALTVTEGGAKGPVLVATQSAVVRQYVEAVTGLTEALAYTLLAPSEAPKEDGVTLTTARQVSRHLNRAARAKRPAVVVCGWDSLKLHLDDLLPVPWGAVVWDESQYAKQGKREAWARAEGGRLRARYHRSRSAAAFQLALKIPHRLATTATPIYDRRGDLYGQLTLVDPFGWGRTQKKFLQRYLGAHEGRYGLVAEDATWTDELRTRMGKVIYSVPKAVSHAALPPTLIDVQIIQKDQLDPEPRGFGKQAVLLGKAASQGSLEAQAKLRELLLEIAAARKRSFVVEDVASFLEADPKGKVLLFSGRHKDAWALHRSLTERLGDRLPPERIWSGIHKVGAGFTLPPDEERHDLRKRYMATEGPLIFVATMGAWGTGLDLQDTDMLGVVMLPPNPGPFIQTLGRVQRLGQRRSCLIRIYVGQGTADSDLSSLFAEKADDLVDLLDETELKNIPRALRGVANLEEALQRVMDRNLAAWEAEDDNEEDFLFLDSDENIPF